MTEKFHELEATKLCVMSAHFAYPANVAYSALGSEIDIGFLFNEIQLFHVFAFPVYSIPSTFIVFTYQLNIPASYSNLVCTVVRKIYE